MAGGMAVSLEGERELLARSLPDAAVRWRQPCDGHLLAVSPCGRRVAVALRQSVVLRGCADGALIAEHPLPLGAASLALGADDALAVGTHGGSVLAWTGETWRPLRPLRARVTALDRRGSVVAAGGSDGQLCWVRLESPEQRLLGGVGAAVTAVVLLSDDALLAARACGAVERWALGEGRLLQRYQGAQGPVPALVVHGSLLLAAGEDRLVHRWELDSGVALEPLAGHERPLLGLGVDWTGLIWSGGKDACLRCWAPEEPAPFPALSGHGGGVRTCCVAGDQGFTGSRDGSVRGWCLSSGRPEGVWLRGSAAITAMLLLPEGGLLVGRSDGSLLRLDAPGAPLWSIRRGHDGPVTSLGWLDGLLLSGGADGALRLWDGAAGTPLSARRDHSSRLRCMALAPDGAQVACGGYDGSLVLAPPLGGSPRAHVQAHEGPVVGCAWVGEGPVTVGMDGRLCRWSGAGEPRAIVEAHGDGAVGVAALDRHRALSVGGDGRVQLWDMAGAQHPVVVASLDLEIPLDGLGVGPGLRGGARVLVGDRYGGAHAIAVSGGEGGG